MKKTGKYSHKNYQCTECFTMETHGTNHWGDIYPYCGQCRKATVWECLEKMPEGYEKPAPWKMVKLGHICKVIEGRKIR